MAGSPDHRGGGRRPTDPYRGDRSTDHLPTTLLTSPVEIVCSYCRHDPIGGPAGGSWDLDGDGYPAWYQPGPYDPLHYPDLGLDCVDDDPYAYPGHGC